MEKTAIIILCMAVQSGGVNWSSFGRVARNGKFKVSPDFAHNCYEALVVLTRWFKMTTVGNFFQQTIPDFFLVKYRFVLFYGIFKTKKKLKKVQFFNQC